MADSPLELYERAYGLHYDDKKIAEATRLYTQIIREFPESNECGYAVIQLEKIKANALSDDGPATKSASNPLVIASLVLNFVAVILLIAASATYLSLRDADRRYVGSLSQAISAMVSGQTETALKALSDLKFKTPGDIVPYALSADIYARAGRYSEALAEVEKFKKINPSLAIPQELFATIEQQKQQQSSRRGSRSPAVAPQPVPEVAAVPETVATKKAPEPAPRPEPVKAARTTRAKAQPKTQSHQDSVSFF